MMLLKSMSKLNMVSFRIPLISWDMNKQCLSHRNIYIYILFLTHLWKHPITTLKGEAGIPDYDKITFIGIFSNVLLKINDCIICQLIPLALETPKAEWIHYRTRHNIKQRERTLLWANSRGLDGSHISSLNSECILLRVSLFSLHTQHYTLVISQER